jgi:hypothetical protein
MRRLTHIEADAVEPTVSPLAYRFLAITADDCTAGGATATEVDRYEKVVYTRRSGASAEVWFASMDGRHEGRLSPGGARCGVPSFSGDGLSLVWRCEEAGGAVFHDTRARWDQDFAAALAAIEFDWAKTPGCEEVAVTPESWATDPCLAKLPRRYGTHAPSPTAAPDALLTGPSYSANQTLIVGGGAGGARYAARALGAPWSSLAPGPVRAVRWSPDGARLALAVDRGVALAATDFYLQEVRNLGDFPELTGQGASTRLHANRFVARPSTDKELFHAYERIRYDRRPPFVTVDSALQVFHDELAALLRARERDALDTLRRLSRGLLAEVSGATDAASRAMAVHFAVGLVLSDAALRIALPEPEPYGLAEDGEVPPDPVALIADKARELAAELPEPLRGEVGPLLGAIFAHDAMAKLEIPGVGEVTVDFTQFKVRGHYATSELAGYFLAMTWYALVPLPRDARLLGLVRAMGQAKAPGEPKATLRQLWDEVDALAGAFMGRPVDVTVAHLIEAQRGGNTGLDSAWDAAVALRGPIPVRGPDGLSGEPVAPRASLFPKRFGLDVGFFKALTHPDVAMRGLPSPLDVFAALGSARARELALAQAQAETWLAAYEVALDAQVAESKARPDSYFATDLYHGWLAVLSALARSEGAADLPFARSEAWRDRQLLSALAGYTVLKHDAVLYSFQDYSAECDSGRPTVVFTEQPVLPVPRGFVEPEPALFEQMARLAGRVYATLGAGEEPRVRSSWGEDIPLLNARVFCERLAQIAAAELRGEPIGSDDAEWLFEVGGVMESLFLGTEKNDALQFGGSEGRLARGVALVTDLHTNPQRGVVLQVATGRLLRLFVAIPDAVGQRLTQGAMYSFHTFTQPMEDRLTDGQWNDLLEAGKAPPMPAWTESFVEPQP